jgi:HEAT repeat protein
MDKLKDPEKPVRISAMLTLARLGQGNSEVKETLTKFSEDSDPETRLNAVVALAGLGKADHDVIPILLQALFAEERATAKAAGRALGNIGMKEPEQILPGIQGILEKGQWPAAGYALRALKQMKAQAASALPQIVKMYDSADSAGRIDILETVSAIDTTGDHALPILVKAVKDPDATDRRDALISLMRFRSRVDVILGPVTGVLKDNDAENRLLAVGIIRGLGREGLPALPDLIAASQDPDLRVRSAALNAIVFYRPLPPEVFDACEKSLKDRDSRVRTAAVNALRNLGQDYPERTTDLLKAALEVEKHGPSKKLIESTLQGVVKGKESKPGGPQDSEKVPSAESGKK